MSEVVSDIEWVNIMDVSAKNRGKQRDIDKELIDILMEEYVNQNEKQTMKEWN